MMYELTNWSIVNTDNISLLEKSSKAIYFIDSRKMILDNVNYTLLRDVLLNNHKL